MRFASPSIFFLLVSSLVGCGSSDPAPAEEGDAAVEGDAAETGSDSGVDAPPAGAGCTVAAKGTAGISIEGIVLVPAGPTKGEVFIDAGGKIACVGASCATAAGYAQATHVKCPSSAIAPAFVNAHDHTDYDAHTPLVHGTTRWTLRHGWRTGANGETKPKGDTSPTTDQRAIAASELRFVMGGATSIVGSGGVSGLARNLAAFKNPEQLEGLTGDTTFFDTFPLGDSKGEIHDSGCAYPSIRSAGTAFSGGFYAPHIAEGISTFSHNEIRCLTTDPNNLVKEQTSIIHAVAIDATDVDLIAKAKAKVIWSPRSNIDLYGNTAPVTELARAGVTIALGTDWVPSGSINVLRELQCADAMNQKYFGKVFDDKALFEMATKNAAIAAGFASQLGTLEVGKMGDVTVFENAAAGYRAVIDAGVEDVKIVLRGGKVLFGDASIVTAVGAPCAALDVCGTAKQACIDTPSVTLADAQAAAGYPLFFCKGTTPTNEPSCIPYRDTYPMGTSATDRDGDGVADSADDCPDVFNPIRPMDGSKQSDVDGDGAGDACDVAPLDPAKH